MGIIGSSARFFSLLPVFAVARFSENSLLVATLFALIMCGSLDASALATVEVRTTDGRSLIGAVDARTNERQLWIRIEEKGIVLSTSVAWDSLNQATVDGQEIAIDELRMRAAEMATKLPEGFLMEYGPSPATVLASQTQVRVGRITSLEIDARLVNLDHTVEPDGYEIAVAAIDEFGNPVPVRGNLYIRLQAERNIQRTGRIRFENVEQWHQPVSPHDFVDGVALYAVRFRAFTPEFDDELRPYAQLNARLGVFGQGSYSATVPVVLWEFNPFRDRLQLFEGSRFFRDEVTRRPRHLSTDPPGIYQSGLR